MIPTIYPYGSVNIVEICFIQQKGERFYLIDKCGRWRITEEMFNYLKEKEIPIYGRECSTTKLV